MTDQWLDAAYDDYHQWKGWQGKRNAAGEVARAVAELRLAGVSPPARLLEVGFGDGAFLTHVHSLGYVCTGLERDASRIETLNAQGITARVGGPEQLAGQTFDVIAAFDVFEHVPLAELIGLLRGLADLLGPNGKLVARFPNMASPFGLGNQYGDITHLTALSPSSFAQIARLAGLQTLHVANGATVLRGGMGLRSLVKPFAFMARLAIEFVFSFAYYGRITPLSPSVVVVMHKRD